MSGNITLYLKKDEHVKNNDIFIDSELNQQQIEGIRFLYKQYQRNNLGVILNNPENYDSSLDVALFLCAIQNTTTILDKPILIICEENKENDWLNHFQKQKQSSKAVIAATNPFMKKTIFINTMEGINNFSRRNWSVMVVHNDVFLKEKLLMAKFDADYKIWITSLDIKKNLKTLGLIYKWIFPKEKFNSDIFQTKPEDKDILSKSILLDTFIEDFVFRTRTTLSSQNKISIKNKDPSGTKVKRSKRNAEELTPVNNERTGNDPAARAIKIAKINNTDKFIDQTRYSLSNFNNSKILSVVESTSNACIDDKQEDGDIESFIRNKKPIKCDSFNDYFVDYDDVLGKNHDEKEKEFMNIKSNLRNEDEQNDSNTESNYNRSKYRKSKLSILSDSDDSAYELETQELPEDNTNKEIKTNSHVKVSEADKISSNVLELIENNINKYQEDNNNHMEVDDEINNEMVIEMQNNDNITTQHTFSNEPEDHVNMNKITVYGRNNKVDDEVNGKDKTTDDTVASQMSKCDKTLSIDSKVTEYEDKIFKKFKGTFLDRIF